MSKNLQNLKNKHSTQEPKKSKKQKVDEEVQQMNEEIKNRGSKFRLLFKDFVQKNLDDEIGEYTKKLEKVRKLKQNIKDRNFENIPYGYLAFQNVIDAIARNNFDNNEMKFVKIRLAKTFGNMFDMEDVDKVLNKIPYLPNVHERKNYIDNNVLRSWDKDEITISNSVPPYLPTLAARNIAGILKYYRDNIDEINRSELAANRMLKEDRLSKYTPDIERMFYKYREDVAKNSALIHNYFHEDYPQTDYDYLFSDLGDEIRYLENLYKEHRPEKYRELKDAITEVRNSANPIEGINKLNVSDEEIANDIKRAYINGFADFKKNTNRDNNPTYTTYHVHIRRPTVDPFNLPDSGLGNARLQIENPFAKDYLLYNEGGNYNFVNADKLAKYLAERGPDLQNDSVDIIENSIFNGNVKDLVKTHNTQINDLQRHRELIDLVNRGKIDKIPVEELPNVLDNIKLYDPEEYRKIYYLAQDRIKEHYDKASSEIEDFIGAKLNVLDSLKKYNRLISTIKDEQLVERMNEIIFDKNNTMEQKMNRIKELEKMKEEDYTTEERQELHGLIRDIDNLNRKRAQMEELKEQYLTNNLYAQRDFNANDANLDDYQRGLLKLQNTLRETPYDIDFPAADFMRMIHNDINDMTNPEDVKKYAKEALKYIGVTRAAGRNVYNIEEYLRDVVDGKIKSMDLTTMDKEQMPEVIHNMDLAMGTVHNLEMTQKELIDMLKNMPDEQRKTYERGINEALKTSIRQLGDDIRKDLVNRSSQEGVDKKSIENMLDETKKEIKEAKKAGDEEQLKKLKEEYKGLELRLHTDIYGTQQSVIRNADDNTKQIINRIAKTEGLINNLQANGIKVDTDNLKKSMAILYKENQKEDEKRTNVILDEIRNTKSMIDDTINQNQTMLQNVNNKYDRRIKKIHESLKKVDELTDLPQGIRDDIRRDNERLFNSLEEHKTYIREKDMLEKQERERFREEEKDAAQRRASFLNNIERENNQTLTNIYNRIEQTEQHTESILESLSDKLKNLHNRGPKISDEMRDRWNNAFSDKEKIRQALHSQNVKMTEDEDAKQKYFKEKISQPKLKQAIGLEPSDPDVPLSMVEDLLPSGFFADAVQAAREKDKPVVKLKTTNYKAVNEDATGYMPNSLKNQLVKIYYYYKDPKHKTQKSNEFPREFLNDLAILSLNGSPKEIKNRYIRYLRTGQI